MSARRGAAAIARRALRALRFVWLTVGVCLIALLIVDWIAGRVVDARDRRDVTWRVPADAYRDEPWARDLWREFDVGYQWEPYTYYRSQPFAGRYTNVGADGLRRTWNRTPPPDDPRAIEIDVFGGSTAWGYGERDESTIPSLLSRALGDAGLAVRVENRAELGHVTTQEVIALLRSLRGRRPPRVVVFYDGFNDVMSLLRNRRAGLTTAEEDRASAVYLRDRVDMLLAALAQHSGLMRLRRYTPPPPAGQPQLAAPLDANEAPLVAELVEVYATNVRVVEEAGRIAGFEPIFFWQPTLRSPKRKLSPWELKMLGFMGGYTAELHERVQQALRHDPRLAADPRFHDLDDAFADVTEPLFIDRAHLNEAGNRLIAERIREHVAQAVKRAAP
jgi:lysophospholipase L1-like esterase